MPVRRYRQHAIEYDHQVLTFQRKVQAVYATVRGIDDGAFFTSPLRG